MLEPVQCIGEIQNKGLGMDVDIFDEKGESYKKYQRENWFAKNLFLRCQLSFGMIMEM